MGRQGMRVAQVVASITLPESSISGWAMTLALASGFSSLPSEWFPGIPPLHLILTPSRTGGGDFDPDAWGLAGVYFLP
jgi:hypothetical protein